MRIFKNGEKPTVEQLSERLEKLEKRMTFIVVPCLTTLLDEVQSDREKRSGYHPLVMWIIAKLREDLPDVARQYLVDLLERFDFGSYRPLGKSQ